MKENVFEISVSTSCFADKNKVSWGSVKYCNQYLTISEFANLVRKGHCFCQCFNTDKEVFSVSEKRDSNFRSAQMVFVDIDDSNIPMAEFVSSLSKQPTLAYTTPNNRTEKSNWLYRFRLCYLLNSPITTVEQYELVYDGILEQVENDIPNYANKDNCGRKASQQFGGNALSDCELIENSIVYSLSDFPIQNNDVSLFFLNTLFSNGKKLPNNDIEISDMEFIDDMERLTRIELLLKYRGKYNHFDHTELHYENGYALIPKDYQEIYRSWYYATVIKGNGSTTKTPRIKKHKDGEGRKKKLFIAGLVMKKILPTITYEHLLYNLIHEVYHYYDNRDKELNNETLKNIATNVIREPIEDIRLQNKCTKKYVVDKQYCAERGIKPNSYKNTVRKILKDEAIGNVYDCSKSVKDNLSLLKDMGIKVSKTKLYDWCRENGVDTKGTAKRKSKSTTSSQCTASNDFVIIKIEKELTKKEVA